MGSLFWIRVTRSSCLSHLPNTTYTRILTVHQWIWESSWMPLGFTDKAWSLRQELFIRSKHRAVSDAILLPCSGLKWALISLAASLLAIFLHCLWAILNALISIGVIQLVRMNILRSFVESKFDRGKFTILLLGCWCLLELTRCRVWGNSTMRSEKSTMSVTVLVALMVNSKGDSGFCLGIWMKQKWAVFRWRN